MLSVGIDIGSSSIKVAEIAVGNRVHRLNRCLEFPFRLDPNFDLRIEILDALRKVAAHYHEQEVQFTLALSQRSVSVRTVAFPFRERHKVQKSLAFELEDEVPFDQEQY